MSYTVAFSHRPPNSETEQLVIVYLPAFHLPDWQVRMATHTDIMKCVISYCGVRPHKIVPLPADLLPKSSLGKLPRSKIRQAFENGEYEEYLSDEDQIIHDHHQGPIKPGSTPMERLIVEICDRWVFLQMMKLRELHDLVARRQTNAGI